MKERISFRPDGSSGSQWRAEPGPRPERGPRAGRQEREAIKRGERPFWRGQNEPRPEERGPAPGGFPPAQRNYEERPQRPPYRANPAAGYQERSSQPPYRPRPTEGYAERPPAPSYRPRPADDYQERLERAERPAPRPGPAAAPEPRPFYERFMKHPVRASKSAPAKPRQPRESAPDESDDLGDDDAPEVSASPTPAPASRAARKLPAPKAAPKKNRPLRPVRAVPPIPAPTETQKTIPELVARIIAKAGREVAADLALRQELKRRRSLPPEAAAQVARTVFRHFRWHGWLNPEAAPEIQIAQANGLAERFRAHPEEFNEADLRAKAVPAWTWDALSPDVAWLRTLQAEPVLWLRTRPGQRDAVAKSLGFTRPGPLPDSLIYEGTEDLYRNRCFQAGEFEIQDVASQAVSEVCAPEPGQFWWDACAGEGGKTLHLADLMQGKGLIYASDRAEWRLERLKMRASRAQCFNFRAKEWTGGPKPPTKTLFDGILLDAPCSGLGTWDRNPHSRWTVTPDDVRELAGIQRNLLENVVTGLKPGGRLYYSVCTLTRAETTDVADAFTAQHPELEPLPMVNPFAPGSAPAPQLMLWPQHTGGNGMFVAAWRKKSTAAESAPAVL
jgi:16S rRNA (cytosine967-C5)-methyltransferase